MKRALFEHETSVLNKGICQYLSIVYFGGYISFIMSYDAHLFHRMYVIVVVQFLIMCYEFCDFIKKICGEYFYSCMRRYHENWFSKANRKIHGHNKLIEIVF